MLLAIDIGNTNIKFALYNGAKQIALWRARSDRKRMADEHAAFLSQSLALKNIPTSAITDSIAVSVVPEITPQLLSGIEHLTGKKPLHAGEAEAPILIDCAIDRPQEAGRDLLITAFAAKAAYKTPMLIIGFGTATTFSIIDQAGRYCGGAIAPGVTISYRALQEAASKLPNVALDAPPKIHGTNTIHAMQSGIYYGTIAMVEGMIRRFSDSAGPFTSIITTGGLSRLFADQIEGVTAVEPDLTLTGLRLVYEACKK